MEHNLLADELQARRDRRLSLSACHLRALTAALGWFWLFAVVFLR